MPIAFGFTVSNMIYEKFELGRTLQSGQFIFSSPSEEWAGLNIVAVAYPGGNILFEQGLDGLNNYLAHEIIHIYQQNDLNGFNAFLNKPYAVAGAHSKFMKGFNKWIYVDHNQVLHIMAYQLENINRKFYYDN